MKKRILITQPLPDQGIQLLKKKGYIVDVAPKQQALPRAELIKRLRTHRYDGLVTTLSDRIDKTILKAAGPTLNIIANYAVGFDNIDLAACRAANVAVTNAPHPAVIESVAEHTIALIFALTHRVVEADQFARDGRYKGWGPQLLLGTDLIGKTVGIVGMGRIGEGVAKRLVDGFGCHIIYTSEHPDPAVEKAYRARRLPLKQLLKVADIVSLHVPLLPSTHHLIGARELAMMKPSAFLINTSRGPVVDEAALIRALKRKQIAGAGIDVFEHEPKIPRSLSKLSNAVLTPHTASATIEARQAMSRTVGENLIAFFQRKTPPNLVTP